MGPCTCELLVRMQTVAMIAVFLAGLQCQCVKSLSSTSSFHRQCETMGASWRDYHYGPCIGVAAVSFFFGIAFQQACQQLQRMFNRSTHEDAVQQVKDTTQMVVHEAQHVSLSQVAIKKSCRDIDSATMASILAPVAYDRSIHFVDGTSRTLQYLLVLDALNFCFWPGVYFNIFDELATNDQMANDHTIDCS